MTKLVTILGLCGLAVLWSCSVTGQAGSQVQSCYDTGHGIVCTNSSEVGEDDDVDGDGETDELVCGDADSSAESLEDDGADDGADDTMITEGDETEDDVEDDGDTESESAEGDSASEDCSSSDGDDDDDGMPDEMDCDCAGGGAEEEPPPPDECTDCTPPE